MGWEDMYSLGDGGFIDDFDVGSVDGIELVAVELDFGWLDFNIDVSSGFLEGI